MPKISTKIVYYFILVSAVYTHRQWETAIVAGDD